MIRTIRRDNRILFGPLQERDLDVINREPTFVGYGITANANAGTVEIYVTLPQERATQVQQWFLRNHKILA